MGRMKLCHAALIGMVGGACLVVAWIEISSRLF
jgi:hypothetical protein